MNRFMVIKISKNNYKLTRKKCLQAFRKQSRMFRCPRFYEEKKRAKQMIGGFVETSSQNYILVSAK